jgi:hypothetical protein
VDRSHIRGIRHHTDSSASFSVGDHVEVHSLPNNPHAVLNEALGWRSGKVSNVRSKFVSVEFDQDRHPDQLPEIFITNRLRHLASGLDSSL